VRRFSCSTCRSEVVFEADHCDRCGAQLGYVPELQDLCVVHGGVGGLAADLSPTIWWRCLNHAWGCNWLVARDSGDVWCESCRLTRGRPDTADPCAVEAWSEAERIKRRLVHQLRSLGLPIAPRQPTDPRLVFDLLYLPDGGGATGYHAGAVTLDLREIDDSYREHLRRELSEPFRTVIGHLRHEVGHHYWPILVEGTAAIDEFHALFGDERTDYSEALACHYSSLAEPSDELISTYAAAHPAEDWAETFAHYLHLRDGLETAHEHGIRTSTSSDDFRLVLTEWQELTTAVNRLNEGLGQPSAYPFRISDGVAEKLTFVHRRMLVTTNVSH